MEPVTFQVSMAPSDWRHAQHILPHQMRIWLEQVDEFLVVLDVNKSKGRFAVDWDKGLVEIRRLVDAACCESDKVRSVEVDYSGLISKAISNKYFAGKSIPRKDYRGGPLYSYYYGLHAAGNDLVLHSDSDMLYGGGSQTWVREGIAVLDAESSVVFCSPLAGPPTLDGSLVTQPSSPWPGMPFAHGFDTMSTRVFMTRQSALLGAMGPLPMPLPAPRSLLRALVHRNPPGAAPEDALSDRMRARALKRLDFLGSGPGMWSVHPPMRTEAFYRSLPDVVTRIESGDVPAAQRGAFDLDPAMLA